MLIISFSVLLPLISFTSKINEFLSDKQKEFPDCERVVRNQLFIILEENRIAMPPYLFETYKFGRVIGEKRTKKLY